MASLDTNVLVRYLVRDDERQLATVQRFISRCVSEGQVLSVPVTLHAAMAVHAGHAPLRTLREGRLEFEVAALLT